MSVKAPVSDQRLEEFRQAARDDWQSRLLPGLPAPEMPSTYEDGFVNGMLDGSARFCGWLIAHPAEAHKFMNGAGEEAYRWWLNAPR